MKERKYLNLGKVGWGMFLASALALTSCVNDDEIDNSLQTTSKSIGFSTSYDNNAWEPDQISRGAQISSVNDNWGYKVGAYYHLPNDGGSYDYFDRHSGGFTVSKSTGTANTDYYWPPAGNMQFFAVAPHDAGINVPTLANILNGTKTLTYTIPGDVTEQKDIMVAETANIDCPQASAVGLNFQHLLAGIVRF